MTGWRFFKVAGAALLITVAISQTIIYKQMDLSLAGAIQQPLIAEEVYFSDTLIVDVDEESMVRLAPEFGAWPYKRDIYALVTDYLKEAGAKTIVYDILFSEPREGDEAFARAIQRAGNVVLAGVALPFAPTRDAAYHAQLAALAWPVTSPVPAKHWDDMTLPRIGLAPASPTTARSGVINLTPDMDGLLRRVPLLHESYGKYLPNAALAALFAQHPYPAMKYLSDEQRLQVGQRSWPTTKHGEIILQHPQNPDPFLVMPFYRLVFAALGMPGYAISRAEIEGKTIFIGSTTASLGDYAATPHGIRAGLHIMALIYQNLAQNTVLHPPKLGWDLVLILTSIAFLAFSAYRPLQSPIILSLLAGASITAAYLSSLGLLAFLNQQSALLFSITNSFTLYLLMVLLRIKTLYDEKQKLYYEKMAAEQASAFKSKFLSYITHELRTPLTAIMGFNSLVSENKSLSPDERNATKTIDTNSENLLRLVNNLLDQAKIEAGKMDLEVRAIAIRDTINDVLATFARLAASKNVEMKMQYDVGVPQALMLDGFRVRQIIINLVGNALKFTEQGHVLVRAGWQGGWLEVSVEDTGPGISSSTQEKIFSAFQQGATPDIHAYSGTGLGLTISRYLAQLMGGTLSVESMLGRGSTFFLRIPADAPELPHPCAAPAGLTSLGTYENPVGAADAIPQPQATKKLTGCVLLADDSEDARILFKNFFDRMGLISLFATNGQAAVDIALVEQPDIILMDMEMPVMNGLEAVRLLRQRGYAKPILALTAHTHQAVSEALLEAGFDGCLEKPIKQDALQRGLAVILQPSRH